MSFATVMLIALALDAVLGWPDALFRRIGHPVTWIGQMIAAADRRLNRAQDTPARRRALGLIAAIAIIALCAALGGSVQWILPDSSLGTLVAGVLAWPLLAMRSLHDHVKAVATPLMAGDMAAARRAVSMIVGRDPAALEAGGIGGAAIESLAENTSDGVVAPLVWGVVLGLPGIAAYKAINTLDSMIGHRTARHAAFGWAAARIDDLANLVPARLTGLLFVLVSVHARRAWACMRQDASKHRSPNAGWPEAAMAGAIGVRLSGPRVYGGASSPEPWLNANAADPQPADLRRALSLFRRAMAAMACGLVLIMLVGG
ncbi:MAG: adenosylcobinamide-phosphate synthase CbiB [Rhodobacteraceae bacterium HLUCCA12]|nr:MAG: adenosylcobinamide-phosphate synthase CbiB [Rhodobacteraceae bacterium HLUCCA12]